MKSHRSRRFREAFDHLPREIQTKAKKAFKLWKADPYHPSFQFKQVHSTESIVSVRITLGWRALGVRQDDTVVWFWIGSHSDYDKLVSEL
ncbi:MAG TPA: hypothetical protein VI704_02455 [Bacteroidota bacterium]|nr:hypothetical protein [Bacteroidota bacterium]